MFIVKDPGLWQHYHQRPDNSGLNQHQLKQKYLQEQTLYEQYQLEQHLNKLKLQGAGGGKQPGVIYPFPAWNKTPYTSEDDNQFVLALGSNIIQTGEPTITTITASLGTGGWSGGVVSPNGMIYFPPLSSTNILKLDPTTDTFSLIGPTFSTSTDKYQGGVLSPNGSIYFFPGRSGNVLKLDPTTDTVTQIAASYGNGAFAGAIVSPQGNIIYTVPRNSPQILRLDTTTDTITSLVPPTVNVSTNKWNGAVLAADGKIYMMPNSSNVVLELDPVTEQMVTLEVLDTSLRNQYLGAVLGPNGLIYAIPNESFQLMIFDTVTKTATFSSNAGYNFGGVMGPNGVIYMNNFIFNIVPTVDTANNSKFVYDVPARGAYWYGGGGAMSLNGNVYLSGNNTSGSFVKIAFPGDNTIDPNWVLSRQTNKYY